MNNEEMVNKLISKIESIEKSHSTDKFDTENNKNKREIVSEILEAVEEVLKDENN